MIEQMDCNAYRAHLDEWLDGELDERTRAAMEAHAECCEDCAAEMRLARSALDLTRSLGAEAVVPLDVQAAWRRSVRRECERARARRRGFGWRAIGSVAAALALLMGCTLGFRAGGVLDQTAAPAQAVAQVESRSRARELDIWQTYASRSAPTAYSFIASDGMDAQPASDNDLLTARSVSDAPDSLLIRSAGRSILTDEFDAASQRLRDLTEQYGGYMEEDTVSTGANGLRTADMVCVAPAQDADDFLLAVDHVGVVTRTTEHFEDTSANVQDVTERMSVLESERDRLSNLIEAADSAEELERLKALMRSTLTEIESLQADHARLSNELNHVCVAIHLEEAAAVPVADSPTGLIGRMSNAFTRSVRDLKAFARDMAVSLMVIAPYALIALGVAALLYALARLTRRLHWRLHM